MSDVLIEIGVQTGSLAQSIRNEIKAATGGKEYTIKLAAEAKSLQDSLNKLNTKKNSLKVNLDIRRGDFTTHIREAIAAVNNNPAITKLKIDIDGEYIKSQLNAALSGKGSANFGSTKTTSSHASNAASEEDSVSKKLKEQEQAARLLTRAYSELNKVRNALANIPRGSFESNELKNNKDAIDNLIHSFQNGGKTAEEFRSELAQLTGSNAELIDSAKESGTYASSLSNKLQSFKMHLSTIMSIARGFMMLRRVIQPIVNAVTEVDTALTQLKIVTQANNQEIESYANNIMKVADQTAGSVKDLINSTTTFSRLGYTLEESTELAKYTQMLENVGDIDESSATSAITAIVKAYDVGVDELQGVMDKLVETGNHFPISVSEIAEGMNNAGSMLAVATEGNFDKSVALLTAANTTIQNISKSSTGLRTIAARIRNVGTELDELGETMTKVEYDNIVKALTDNGVALTDQAGELRNTYDILYDLSQIWDTMSANEQAALAKTLSGTRQQNVFISLMENFKEASGAMERMATSEGALSEANDVYLNSVQARVQQLKNSFVEFSQSTISADVVKQFADLAKFLLQATTAVLKFINAFGGIRTLIPLAVSLFAIFKGEKIISGFAKMSKLFTAFGANAKSALAALFSGQLKAIGSTNALTGAEAGNVITTASLAIAEENAGNAALSMGAKMQVAMGIIGIIAMAISAAIALISGVIRQAKEWRQAMVDMGKEAGESASTLIDAYSNYTSMIASGDTSTDEFVSTQDELRQSLGLTANEFQRLAGSTMGYSAALKQAAIDQLELDISTQSRGLEAQALSVQEEINKSLGSLMTSVPNLNDFFGSILDEPAKALNADYFIENADSIRKKLVELKNELGEESPTYNSLLDYYTRMTDATAEYAKEIDSLNNNIVHKSMLELGDASATTAEEFDNYRNKLIDAVSANKEFHGSEQEVIDVVNAVLSTTPGLEDFYTQAEKAALGTDAFSRGLQGIKDVAEGTSAAVTKLDEILKGDDYDTGMEKRVGYYDKLLEEIQGENWGGKHYAALADYFGIDINQSVDEQIAAVERLRRYFDDADQGMYNFLMDINEKVPEAIANFNEDTGTLWWDSAELQSFADAMGITRDALIDLLDAYVQHVPPSEWMALSPQEASSWLEQDNVINQVGDSLVVNKERFDELAEAAGVSSEEMLSSILELRGLTEGDLIQIDVDTSSIENAVAWIREFSRSTDDIPTKVAGIASALSGLSAEEVSEILIEVNLPPDIESMVVSMLPPEIQENLTLDTTEGEGQLDAFNAEVEAVITDNNGKEIVLTVTDGGTIKQLENRLNWLVQQGSIAGFSISRGGTGGQHTSGGGRYTYATGTKHSGSGPALLGDEYSASGKPRPELVVSGGQAYLAGVNGPVVKKLNAGDVVYTYKQTKQILGNNLDKINSIPAFSSGSASRYWNKLSGSASSLSKTSTYSNYYGTSSGSGSSGSSASTSGSGENWFEQQYELHNHYRKLDQETDAAYLTWLTGAWKKAYAEGVIELKDAHKYEEEAYELMKKIAADRFKEEYQEHQHNVAMGQETDQEYYSWLEWRHQTAYANNEITLEEYWKYQEEVYKKARELVNDYFNDIDKKIDMLENAGKSDVEIIEWDEAGMAYVQEQIAKLKKEGKDNNDSTVQGLQKTWWSYYNDRKKREEETTKNAKSAAKELIDYRIKMLKKDLDAEKDNLNKRLKNLQDFYSKQKDMLQDSYDEDKYLEEQAEKRKAVSDLEIQLAQLEYDNSAWAQKRRLELSQELFEAQKALADFEKDHALEVAKEKLDAIQEMQEKELNDQIDAVEKTATSEADLYKQALKDVQSGGRDLYEAMVAYNNTEGTGNPEDITEMWDDAYTSLKKYKDLFDEYYKDIRLSYGTDTTPAVVDTSKIDAGLNPVVPKLEPEPAPKPTPAATPVQAPKPAPAPAKADPKQGDAVQLKSGAKLATNSYASPSLNAASWTIGRTLYIQAYYPGRAAPYHVGTTKNINDGSSTWVGWVNKSQLVGYASGTKNALPGIHEINERGDEALFKTSDGSTYRLFSGGEHVFNSKATDFLHEFANNPETVLANILGAVGSGIGSEIKNNTLSQNISLGDIYIQGSASEKTISEIRREKRSEMDYMLRELNRLNK